MKSISRLLPFLPIIAFAVAQDAVEIETTPEGENAQPAEDSNGSPGILEEVVVTADRGNFLKYKGTVTSIDQKSMQEIGVQDLASAVKYDPNVVVPFDMTTGDGAVAYGGFGTASFNIRGTEGNRVAVEVDGIRQPPEYLSTSFDAGAETGSGGMGRDYFDPSMFQLVEIVKGGASALYSSDAMGGVVSMQTLDPTDLYRDASWGGLLRTQFFSSNDGLAWQLGGGGRTGKFDYMLLYAGRDTNETSNNGEIPPDPMTMSSEAWLGKIGYNGGGHVFQFTFEHYRRQMWADMQSALHGPNSMFNIFQKSIENWQDVERLRFSLEWVYEPAGTWVDNIRTLAYWQDATNSSRNVSTNPPIVTGLPPAWGIPYIEGRNRRQWIDFETEIYGVNSVAQVTFSDTPSLKNILHFGTDLSLENASNRFDRVETRGIVNFPNADVQTIVSDRISFAPSETYRGALFFQNDITLDDRWDISPGVRLDYYEIKADISDEYLSRLTNSLPGAEIPEEVLPQEGTGYDNLAVSPSIDFAFHPTDESRIYAGYAMSTRNPTAEELTMVFDHPSGDYSQLTVPNTGLNPETSHAFKIGYKIENDRGRFGIETFYTRFNHFIENNIPIDILDDGTVLTTTLNRGSAEIYGIEAGGEWIIGADYPQLDGFTVGLNLGYTIGDNRTTGQPINTIEPFRSVGYLGYADPDGRFGSRLIGTFTGAVTRTDDTSMNGKMFHPDSWFTLDLVAWWKPVERLTINAGLNNIFDEQYWNWSTVRRGGGHLGLDQFGGQASSVTDRTTAPGRNFFVSATYQF